MPPDPETLGVTRRQFLNRGIVTLMSFGLAGFGASLIAFLWPRARAASAPRSRVGKITDINADDHRRATGFAYYPEGRMWITDYPAAALEKAKKVSYTAPMLAGMEAGFVALYQKCVHLGCRVPELPHVAVVRVPVPRLAVQPGRREEGRPGAAWPRPLPPEVAGGAVTVEHRPCIIQGPPIGTNTTGQEAEGPHCVGGGGAPGMTTA